MALTQGLLAWWNLDEVSGARVDSVGGGGSLTASNVDASNGGTWITAASRGAVCVSGAPGSFYVGTTTPDTSSGAGSFSIAAWGFLTAPTTPTSTTALISKYDSDAVGLGGWALGVKLVPPYGTANETDINFFSGYLSNGDFDTRASYFPKVNPTLNIWHHFVGTWDNIAGVGQLFFDGVLVAFKKTVSAARITTSTGVVRVGAAYSGASPHFGWDGIIDDFGIWSRVLRPAEVGDLYYGRVGRQYPFDLPIQA